MTPTPIVRSESGKTVVYCNRTLCTYLGRASVMNTRAYCKRYQKWLAGSAMHTENIRVCAECKKAALNESRTESEAEQ